VNIEVGLRGEATVVVGPNDTARAMRSGSVDALATPRVIALCEEAAVAAVEDRVPDGYTTVGMRVQVDHLQPSGLGTAVVAEATLEKVEGRRLTFTVSASDQCGLVAAGKVTRVLVDLEKFNSKVR
jgi:predicted thioesterase